VKNKKGNSRLMGFGHRVYKNYDPRAKILKTMCDEVLAKLGMKDPMLDMAKELEAIALQATTTSSRRSSTRTSISTAASSTGPWASRPTCSPSCSRSAACRAGWRTGRRWSRTSSRRSAARARSTPARPSRPYVPIEQR
jgi:hypothetical protein